MSVDIIKTQEKGWLKRASDSESIDIWEEIYPESFYYTCIRNNKVPVHIVKNSAPSNKDSGIEYLRFVSKKCLPGVINYLIMFETFEGPLTKENPSLWFSLKAVKDLADSLKGGLVRPIHAKRPEVITIGPNSKVIQSLIAYTLGLKPITFENYDLAEDYIMEKLISN